MLCEQSLLAEPGALCPIGCHWPWSAGYTGRVHLRHMQNYQQGLIRPELFPASQAGVPEWESTFWLKNRKRSQAWLHTPVIPAFWWLTQEDLCAFEASLCYIAS